MHEPPARHGLPGTLPTTCSCFYPLLATRRALPTASDSLCLMQGRVCLRTGHVHPRPDYTGKFNALSLGHATVDGHHRGSLPLCSVPLRAVSRYPIPHHYVCLASCELLLPAGSNNDSANGMQCAALVANSAILSFPEPLRRHHTSNLAEFSLVEESLGRQRGFIQEYRYTYFHLLVHPDSLTQTTSSLRHARNMASASPQSFAHSLVRVSTSNVSHAVPSIALIQNMMQARIVASPRSPCFTLPHQLGCQAALAAPAARP